MSDIDRVRWHCRRGMLELDLVLTRFVDLHFADLTPGQRAAFNALLDCSDNDLWELVSGHAELVDATADRSSVLGLLRAG